LHFAAADVTLASVDRRCVRLPSMRRKDRGGSADVAWPFDAARP